MGYAAKDAYSERGYAAKDAPDQLRMESLIASQIKVCRCLERLLAVGVCVCELDRG